MDPFINYPPEMIQKICNELDTPSLIRASEASSRLLQVCSDIIKDRQISYEAEKQYKLKIKEYKDYIKDHYYSRFEKNLPQEDITWISVQNYTDKGMIRITQYVPDYSIPWILSIPYVKIDDNNRHVMLKASEKLYYELATNLVNQGYEID